MSTPETGLRIMPADDADEQPVGAALVRQQTVSLAPRSLAEALEFARLVADSELAPGDYRGKPGNVVIAVQMGAELGLAPMQSLQNIAVIKGRPSVWGDALPALCYASGKVEWMRESTDDEVKATGVAWFETKRFGNPAPILRTFSLEDATTAGLIPAKPDATWSKYPRRMLFQRARGWALRDAYPDVLRGISIAEEVMDMPEAVLPERPSIQQPRAKTPPAAPAPRSAPDASTGGLMVTGVSTKSGTTKDGNPYKIHTVSFSDGTSADTFSESVANDAEKAKEDGVPVRISVQPNSNPRFAPSLKSLTLDFPEPGAQG